ncbi:recombinase family protein [Bradyrhizobium sp. JYMT SZCCT0180]|uniref:recombinase family protein n=1 Tax=Bradyrhizobium sp. JYMT SZCCT0180 TaxID=2807666 RepID=UPI001BA4F3E8|nr:recombinase family protein [Bradyrhizobium sp. JYMT SZCCT0180]MBR1215677.1 recombinase family protein [Bradyrhizobium sp. JYMT SZCCT0180]
MANSLVVRKGTDLAKRNRALRAAQYIRMSTDYQRYSVQNQAAAIAVHAQQKNLTIVRTYIDEGRSGLRIKGRAGLIELIDDVQSGRADFDHILVYDVSRWGRFQDVDESAHYEFLCRHAGMKVAYCAEQFDNDGSLLSSIVKNLKRVMAAEFSRELSTKIHAAQLRGASLGFRQGGPLSFGLRREVIDENQISKGYLKRGQQKNLKTDRVVLRLGLPNEVAVIQRIFNEYVEGRKSEEEIARRLNREGIPNHRERPWTRVMVNYILRNENYIGNTVYNRESSPLGGKATKNPPSLWVRSKGSMPPVIDRNVFHLAQRRLTLRWQHLTDDELLSRLKSLLEKEGRLSQTIMNRTLGIPSIRVYDERFGSMRNAYRRIGYNLRWDTDWIERKSEFKALLHNNAADLVCRLARTGAIAKFEPGADVLRINKRFVFSLRLARCWRGPDRKVIWTINRRTVLPKGYIVAIRLDEGNNKILDYLLLPTKAMTKSKIRFMEAGLHRFDSCRFQTPAQLTKAILYQLNGVARGPACRHLPAFPLA